MATKMSAFGSAFASARKSGAKTFSHNGKSYTTELAKPAAKSASAKSAAPARASDGGAAFRSSERATRAAEPKPYSTASQRAKEIGASIRASEAMNVKARNESAAKGKQNLDNLMSGAKNLGSTLKGKLGTQAQRDAYKKSGGK